MLRSRGVVVVVAMATATAVFGVGGFNRERVPLPTADATPEEVVTAYIRAINAGDCGSMEALSDAANSVGAWCGDITVTDVVTGEPFPDTCCGPGRQHGQVMHVPVTFTTRGGDVSMPDGEHAWGYILVRDDDAERWRVASEGAG